MQLVDIQGLFLLAEVREQLNDHAHGVFIVVVLLGLHGQEHFVGQGILLLLHEPVDQDVEEDLVSLHLRAKHFLIGAHCLADLPSFQQEQYLDGVAKDILVLDILEYLLCDLIVACFQCTLQKGIIGDQTRLMAG